ncbi:radical SAM family heme chaperone HemW [Rhodospirillum sp. A1_3_36]|uniref:radical SAM family heme chaperone HemW n=1 Tax=Rhodospirillum sp. A1_3_36 TaxID=3391666 RepID=UPI0039A57F78
MDDQDHQISTVTQGDEGFGLYIHWPFCLSKCPYCDFNSHVVDTIDHGIWSQALITDLETQSARLAGQGRMLTSIFLGGGTPSLMAPNTVAALIDRASDLWPTAPDLEITLEANPGTVDRDRFRDFKLAGVNRLSLGIQSLEDRALQFLGRVHDAKSALAALDTARSLFDRFSFDLIYARPGQTLDHWEAELRRALTLGSDHLSVYQLTIEQGTRFFGAYCRGDFTLPDEDESADLFLLTRDILSDAGLPAYEVSNHARPGQESRHNLIYWRGGDYLGVGPGAHGRLRVDADGFRATVAHRRPESWLKRVEDTGTGLKEESHIPPRHRAQEMLMMGLRLAEGVSDARMRRLTGLGLADIIDRDGLSMARSEGLIECEKGQLRATDAGIPTLNALTAALMVI